MIVKFKTLNISTTKRVSEVKLKLFFYFQKSFQKRKVAKIHWTCTIEFVPTTFIRKIDKFMTNAFYFTEKLLLLLRNLSFSTILPIFFPMLVIAEFVNLILDITIKKY